MGAARNCTKWKVFTGRKVEQEVTRKRKEGIVSGKTTFPEEERSPYADDLLFPLRDGEGP